MMFMNLRDIATLNIKGSDYCYINSRIRGHKLNAKYQFDLKKQNVAKHKKVTFIYKNG